MGDRNENVYPPGQHYSGAHRVPNIKQFVESLDRDKKHRDAKIDQEAALQPTANEAVQHPETSRKMGKNRRTVRDPVTGRDVQIDDFDNSIMKTVENPMVSP